MDRKKPYRHPVRAHIRSGHQVHHYERGEGKAPVAVIGAKSLGGGEHSYRVNVNYADSEAFQPEGGAYPVQFGAKTNHYTIRARSYLEAMDQGLARLGSGYTPISVTMRRL